MPYLFSFTVKWCGAPYNKIFTAGLDGEIHAYNIDLKDVGKNEEMVHTGHILDLLPIPSMGYIASAGMDKKIVLWHMDTLKPKHTFQNGH